MFSKPYAWFILAVLVLFSVVGWQVYNRATNSEEVTQELTQANEEIQKQLEGLEEDRNSLIQENQALRTLNENLKSENESSNTNRQVVIDELIKQIADSDVELQQLAEFIDQRMQLASIQDTEITTASEEQKSEQLKTQFKTTLDLNALSEDLRSQLETALQTRQNASQNTQRIQQSFTQISDQEIQRNFEDEIQFQLNTILELREVNKNLQNSLDIVLQERQSVLEQGQETEQSFVEFTEDLDNLGGKLNKSKETIQQLTQENQELAEVKNQLSASNKNLNSALEELKDRLEEFTSGSELEETQTSETSPEIASSETGAIETKQPDVEIDVSESELEREALLDLDELNNELDSSIELALQLRNYDFANDQTTNEILILLVTRFKQIRNELQETNKDFRQLANENSNLEPKYSEFASTLKAFSEGIDQLERVQVAATSVVDQTTVLDSGESESSMNVDTATEESDAIEKKLARAEFRNDYLATRLKYASKHLRRLRAERRDIENLESDLAAQQEKTEYASKHLRRLRAERRDVENLENTIQVQQDEIQVLSDKYANAQFRTSYLDTRLRYASKHLRRLRSSSRDSEFQIEQLIDSLAALEQDLTQTIGEFQTLQSELSVISLKSDVLFDSGSTDLKPQGREALLAIVDQFNLYPERIVSIGGHTDNVPIKGYLAAFFPSNWELSSSRAASAAKFLIANGIPAHKIQIVGFGDLRPIVPNDSEENRAKNRRIEIRLVPELPEQSSS